MTESRLNDLNEQREREKNPARELSDDEARRNHLPIRSPIPPFEQLTWFKEDCHV